MTNVNLSTSTVNVNLVGGAPVQVVFEQGEPRQVVLSLANTVLSTGSGEGGGYPALTMPTGFSVSGSGTALIAVTYSTGYSLPTTTKQSEWDSAFTDRLKWDGSSTGLNASVGRASLQLGTAATAAATDFAPAAQGVTNGNGHDHSGGDGAQIAYSSLSGLPGLVTSSEAGLASATDKQKIDIAVVSDVTGITGADAVTNIVSVTQAEYDAIASPSASTLYVITS